MTGGGVFLGARLLINSEQSIFFVVSRESYVWSHCADVIQTSGQ